MKRRAWFFGDSFIYGWGCRDKTNDHNKLMSQIISEYLGCEEINLAKYGYSNENIIFSIIKSLDKIKKDDYVIIFDTFSGRGIFVLDEWDYYSSWPDDSYFEISKSEHQVYNLFRNNLSSKLLIYYQTIYKKLQNHFNSIGINCYYFPSQDNWWEDKKISNNLEEIGGHWSFRGHRQVADWVISVIEKKLI